jgi:hypothetical protein
VVLQADPATALSPMVLPVIRPWTVPDAVAFDW